MWRQFLESLLYQENCFVTLTYNEAHCPADGNLEKRALQLFIKRLRKALHPRLFRYFAVGEYGDEDWRPHFHLSLFGVWGLTEVLDKRGTVRHHGISEQVANAWSVDGQSLGFSLCAEFNTQTAHYVAGYTTKKLHNDHWALADRGLTVGEFARMSNRPGIGYGAMAQFAKDLLAVALPWETGDVPHSVSVGKKTISLSRYMVDALRREAGFDPDYIKEIRSRVSQQTALDLLAMLGDPRDRVGLKAPFLASIEGKLRSVEARSKLHSAKRKL